jgi:hypothetical protein
MNRERYSKDPRYWAVWQKMQLLQIEDVSTSRQEKKRYSGMEITHQEYKQ